MSRMVISLKPVVAYRAAQERIISSSVPASVLLNLSACEFLLSVSDYSSVSSYSREPIPRLAAASMVWMPLRLYTYIY